MSSFNTPIVIEFDPLFKKAFASAVPTMAEADPYAYEDYLANDATMQMVSVFLAAMTPHAVTISSFHVPMMGGGRPIVFKGLPTPKGATLINTPEKGYRPPHPSTHRPVTEALAWCISAIAKTHPHGYHNEKRGDIIHQVIPVKGSEAEKSNMGSGDFDFHIEAPHHKTPPDGLLLLGVRNREKAETNYSSIIAAVESLDPTDALVLGAKEFRLKTSPSFGADRSTSVAVMEIGEDDNVQYRVDFEEMEGETPRANRAMANLRTALKENQASVVIGAGDGVLIPNRLVAHGRKDFPVTYDGGQRWMQRTYLTKDRFGGEIGPDAWANVYPWVLNGDPENWTESE